MSTLLITGGCGFIGSHFVRHCLRERPQDKIVNYDLLTYAGNPAEGFAATVEWYKNNESWWAPLLAKKRADEGAWQK